MYNNYRMQAHTTETMEHVNINRFLHAMSTDENGKIGCNYTDYIKELEYILSITPEKFEKLYDQYKVQTQYVSSNPSNQSETTEKQNFVWLYDEDRENRLRCIKEIYNELKKKSNIYDNKQQKYVSDNRPLTFRFALLLWLYIYH